MQLLNSSADNQISVSVRIWNYLWILSLRLSLGLLKATVTLCSFVVILWSFRCLSLPIGGHEVSIPGYMVWVAVFILPLVHGWQLKLDNLLLVLILVNSDTQTDFRFGLMRLRENSGVALYGGEQQEQVNLLTRFHMVVTNFRYHAQAKETDMVYLWIFSNYFPSCRRSATLF